MQIEQIDRCPFCDCSWVVLHRPINGAHVSVKCKGCNAHGPGHAGITDEEAVAAWNKIPRLARPDSDMVERVQAAVERELGTVEMVLADPITIRRLQAERITRAAIAAITGESA